MDGAVRDQEMINFEYSLRDGPLKLYECVVISNQTKY